YHLPGTVRGSHSLLDCLADSFLDLLISQQIQAEWESHLYGLDTTRREQRPRMRRSCSHKRSSHFIPLGTVLQRPTDDPILNVAVQFPSNRPIELPRLLHAIEMQ